MEERETHLPSPHLSMSHTTMLYNTLDNFYTAGHDSGSSVRMSKTDELSDFSSQSILCAMDRFVKAVNNMNDTVMVPCRLLDVGSESEAGPGGPRGGGDPYNLYNVLNCVKNDLIWGPSSNDEDEGGAPSLPNNNTTWSEPTPPVSAPPTPPGPPAAAPQGAKGHFRRQSTLSSISMCSDGESEGGSEGGDSGVEGEEGGGAGVMAALRGHLVGLHLCLNTLTDAAAYVTDRYQHEVDAQ